MNKFIFLCVFCAFGGSVTAQENMYKKMPSFGIHFSLIDYNTAADLRSSSLPSILEKGNWSKMGRMNPALTVSYSEGLTDHIDFSTRLTSAFLRYPFQNPVTTPTTSKFYLESDAMLNVKLLTDNYLVVPYLQGGLGAALAGRTFLAHIPLGAGLQVKLSKESYVHLNANYRVAVSDRSNYSLFYSFGIVAPLKSNPVLAAVEEKKAEMKAEKKGNQTEASIPQDRDGDGVLDESDACPDVKGLANLKGCPDSDKDGITDQEDKCPNEAGISKYQGCPIPDSDKDGINDENDKCVDVIGVARYEGCPVPDGDKDGVNDEVDRCPAVSGDPSNNGCPKITYESAPILFAVNSSSLSATAKKELDKAVQFLNENKDVSLAVIGYTDNTGTNEVNNTLSLSRANACVTYLVEKGISQSRLAASGLASDHPVGDNSTGDGRKLNRRVELKVAD